MSAHDDTVAVRADEGIDVPSLRAWLAAAQPTFVPAGTTLDVRQYPSGFSNLTYLVTVHTDDGARAFVLRRPPRGVTRGNAHDVLREFRILSALSPLGVPVPGPVASCDDPGVIGAPFYLMEHVDGVILRGNAERELGGDDDARATRLGALSHTFVETLAQLHTVSVTSEPLLSMGKPAGYVQRQVQGWTTRWNAARTEAVPDIDTTAKWLDAHRPPDRDAALIHNDFKFDNLVLDRAAPARVRAILDWEMATIGDPLMDLGTSLAYWVEAGDAPIFRSLGLGVTAHRGSLTRAELVAAYAAQSGRDVSDAPFYYAFGLFKVAVIAQQILARSMQGLSADPRFAKLGEVVRALGDAASTAIVRGAV